MKKYILLLFTLFTTYSYAQDTFSIIAIDSTTGEVGAAGASCVDLFNFPYPPDFISVIIPGKGGANCQSYYDSTNKANAVTRIMAGDSASQVIKWLVSNDAQNDSTIRQYGIVTFVGGHPQAAGATGSFCFDYKEDRARVYYSIQGNILLGKKVIDSIESRFLAEKGSLACKLMAALQGGKMVGADTRCASNGTSTLFAFLKVTKPSDAFGSPYIFLGVKTHDGAHKEPIDSLQKLFDLKYKCGPGSNIQFIHKDQNIELFPNPVKENLTLKLPFFHQEANIMVYNSIGQLVLKENSLGQNIMTLNTSELFKGFYFIEIETAKEKHYLKFIKE